jgi:acyl carrier protein
LEQTQEHDWIPSEGATLVFDSYGPYVAACTHLRTLQERSARKGMSLLAYFPNLQSDAVHVVFGRRPMYLAETVLGLAQPAVLTFEEPSQSQRLKRAICDATANAVPIGQVRLLYKAPTTSRGKFDRQALQEVARRAATARLAVQSLEQLLGIGELDITMNLYQAGMTSMEAVRASLTIKSRFNATISPSELFNFDTIADLITEVRRQAGAGTRELQDA